MSSRRTFLGIVVTTGSLTLGGSALMGYSLKPPNYLQGVTVLDIVPPSSSSEAFFAASPGGGGQYHLRDRDYVPSSSSTSGDDQPSMQSNSMLKPDLSDEHQ